MSPGRTGSLRVDDGERGFHRFQHASCAVAAGWDAAMLLLPGGPDVLVCRACGFRFDAPPTGVLADAFDVVHRQWGLRGDPHVWGAMRDRLSGVPTPRDVEPVLLAAFTEACGIDLRTESEPQVHVPALDHGGMSGGFVDVGWWRTKGIPLMVARATRPHPA